MLRFEKMVVKRIITGMFMCKFLQLMLDAQQ